LLDSLLQEINVRMPYTRTNNYTKPIGTPAATPLVKTEGDVVMADATNGAEKETPAWLTKIKEGGVKKVPKDVQKRRRNFRIKKMLTPKPPMMVLFELVKPNEIQFDNFISDPMTRLLKVAATYNGQTYEGIGPSKAIAKNICCEQILQHIAFSSCTSSPAAEGEDGKVGEESTPWTALASVALFKLFNDWQAQGVKLPTELLRQGGRSEAANQAEPMEGVTMAKKEPKEPRAPREPKGPKVLPENPTSRHPVQLLNEMEGQLQYDTSCDGIPPQANFTVTVTVKDKKFIGTSKNKKDAKKIAATSAMAQLYDVHYPA